MKTIPVGEFKARCLTLMDDVRDTREPIGSGRQYRSSASSDNSFNPSLFSSSGDFTPGEAHHDHSSIHGDFSCGDVHHGGCDVGGHGSFDGGGHH